MAITTKLQTKYTAQRVFMIGICLVMGLWGLYDYFIKIPNQARLYERGQVCVAVKQALEQAAQEPGTEATDTLIATAKERVSTAVASVVTESQPDPTEDPSPEAALQAIKDRGEAGWFAVLAQFARAITEAERRTSSTVPPSEGYAAAFEAAERGVNATDDVTPPAALDRLIQIAFILCLPFVPWFIWGLAKVRKQVFTLADDGTLSGPGFEWPKDAIADIDMSRWMKKSIATVVHTDGTRVNLDDYVHKDVDRIVGALAHERYPDEWTEDAREVKDEPADHDQDHDPEPVPAGPEDDRTDTP